MARMKPYDELEFVDDFVFCKVMRREEICKKVIELILGVKIKSIRTFDSQHAIELTANGKGVRLDVIVDDDEGTIYNIEMQTSFLSLYSGFSSQGVDNAAHVGGFISGFLISFIIYSIRTVKEKRNVSR